MSFINLQQIYIQRTTISFYFNTYNFPIKFQKEILVHSLVISLSKWKRKLKQIR